MCHKGREKAIGRKGMKRQGERTDPGNCAKMGETQAELLLGQASWSFSSVLLPLLSFVGKAGKMQPSTLLNALWAEEAFPFVLVSAVQLVYDSVMALTHFLRCGLICMSPVAAGSLRGGACVIRRLWNSRP